MTFLFQLISILFQLMRLIIQWTLWSEKYGKRHTLQIWKKIWADILWCCAMSAQIPKMVQISSFKKKKSWLPSCKFECKIWDSWGVKFLAMREENVRVSKLIAQRCTNNATTLALSFNSSVLILCLALSPSLLFMLVIIIWES